ncbi:MAG: ABC transporter substrate-binding protein [Alsobacter sp.]
MVRSRVLVRLAILGCLAILAFGSPDLPASQALAQTPILRLALQKTGTVSWEVDVIRRHGLDKANGFTLVTTELATTEAGKIAVKGGSADIMVSDWLWVSRERALGSPMQFVPYSATVGALMAPAASPIRGLADLKGKSLSVAGGPLDKSWLLMLAAAKKQGVDLKAMAKVVFGAPPLLLEKLVQGEQDASITFWNFAARLEAQGFRRVLSSEDAARELGAQGEVSMLGYVFDEEWARTNADLLSRFIKAAREAKQILATSDAEWEAIRPLTQASDEATFLAYRTRYREGIPDRPVAEEEADARTLYAVLAEIGGPELVGPGTQLDPGTYWKPPAP